LERIIQQVLTSKVYEVSRETPLERANLLSENLGNEVLLKREDLQPVFSFKIRGAYNKIAGLTKARKARGVICASAGNHAQGVAYAARHLGISATVVMPVTTPQIKVRAVENLGAEVQLEGHNYSEAEAACKKLVAESGMAFIPPFDDELVIAGQGTIAYEVVRQTSGRLDCIFVPVGGGGLISGIAGYLKMLYPNVAVIGVQPSESQAMFLSLKHKRRVKVDQVGIFVDGVAVKQVGRLTFKRAMAWVDEMVLVDTDEVCSAIKAIYEDTRSIMEPAGALAVAGLIKYVRRRNLKKRTLVAVNSGANMNFDRLQFVAERSLIGEKHEALFAVMIPEGSGSLRKFCSEIVGPRNITEFNYRLSDRRQAYIFVGISIRSEQEAASFRKLMLANGYQNVDLTDNELAKTHIRHMVGGRTRLAERELLFNFRFPEHPGALDRFLDAMESNWNISLFHYRSTGGDYGRVLAGMEIPEADDSKLEQFLRELDYSYTEETGNPAYRLFLK